MVKNLILLSALAWVGHSFAEGPTITRESISEARAFKLENAMEEQEAQRSVAGGKTKKKKVDQEEKSGPFKSDSGSEVQYWRYSE